MRSFTEDLHAKFAGAPSTLLPCDVEDDALSPLFARGGDPLLTVTRPINTNITSTYSNEVREKNQ